MEKNSKSIEQLTNELETIKQENKLLKTQLQVHDQNGDTEKFRKVIKKYFDSITLNIKDKKHAENKLREHQELYKQILKNVTDMISIIDASGKFVYASPSHKKYVGYSPEELVGKDVFNLLHPDDLNYLKKIFNEAKPKDENQLYEFRFLTKNGTYKTIEGQGKPIFNNDKTLEQVIISARDITVKAESQKKEDAYLKAYEFLTQTAMELADFPLHKDIYIYIGKKLREILPETCIVINRVDNRNKKITTCVTEGLNKIQEELKDHSEQDIDETINQSLKETVSDKLIYLGESAITKEIDLKTEVSKILVDSYPSHKIYKIGFGLNSELYALAYFIKSQKISRISQYVLEIFTKQVSIALQKRYTEQELSISEKFHRRITENMVDMISISDSKGNLKYVSPAHKKTLGYTENEMLGKNLFDFLHPNDTFFIYNLVNDVLKENQNAKAEFRYRTKKGTYIWLESIGKRLYDNDNNLEGFIFATREITEKKESLNNLSFLSESGHSFLKIPTREEIFQYIGKKLTKKYRKSIVVVTSYNIRKRYRGKLK